MYRFIWGSVYVIGLDLLNYHAKFHGIIAILAEMTFELQFLVILRIFPTWNCHFCRSIRAAGCDIVKLYVLQNNRSCTFCKRKTRGETQFWIELAAPYKSS